MQIVYKLNTASEDNILTHLNVCNNQFVPALNTRVSLDAYAKKMANFAILFEAWLDEKLIGMVAMYLNEQKHGYITNVSVYNKYRGKGIAKQIFVNLLEYTKTNNISEIKLEVSTINVAAINLYKNFGFQNIEQKNDQIIMLKKNKK
jgi:ribosomal protein S18 acetylase RimI-like enzyme